MTMDAGLELFKPIQLRTLSEHATERLRAAIQTGALSPGEQLVERELAAQLGMSRVPVREAIQRLAEEGLVKRSANRGAMVYLPTPQEIEEISSLRIVLEEFVAERVVERWTAEADEELRGIVHRMSAAVEAKERPRLANLDTDFHAALWRLAGHGVLMEVASSLRTRVTRLLFETIALMRDDALPGAIDSHERLLEVLRGGDIERAKQEMRRHIESGKERILAVSAHRSQSHPSLDSVLRY